MDNVGEVYKESCLETWIRKRKSEGMLMNMTRVMMTILTLCRSTDWCAGSHHGLHGDDGGGDSLRNDTQAM